jgi:hypothetical protein
MNFNAIPARTNGTTIHGESARSAGVIGAASTPGATAPIQSAGFLGRQDLDYQVGNAGHQGEDEKEKKVPYHDAIARRQNLPDAKRTATAMLHITIPPNAVTGNSRV